MLALRPKTTVVINAERVNWHVSLRTIFQLTRIIFDSQERATLWCVSVKRT